MAHVEVARTTSRRYAAAAAAVVLGLAGCSSPDIVPDRDAAPTSSGAVGQASPEPTGPVDETPTDVPTPPRPAPRVSADDADVRVAVAAVRHLAGRIGPRPGTSPAYRRAAAWVESRLEAAGWQVRRQDVPTPAGVSWGIPVSAGRSTNLVAVRPADAAAFDAREGAAWLAVGAHLDTVPQAPGAEDNASGVGVLLAIADALADRRTRLPVVLVAFGSEEPRGPGDDDHHYGSRAFVAELTPAQRRGLQGMVSLDRVGVGDVVPVGSAAEPNDLTRALERAARRAGTATTLELFERSSDHWSFVRDGLPAARLGSTPYAGYHSAGDVPAVVDRRQLDRVIRLTLAWLR
ncbi:M28 family metallopeptidase [Nocardioides sp. R-C-SC26]|uniref:M28 family metallopeptidase n=1 Tax=Nocardioides sp. R-C-SC26 TaxID=2870414 RepID=UPI001E433D2C|nr:M28 family peptidase [Nocardioides sp. R-C-SC26]